MNLRRTLRAIAVLAAAAGLSLLAQDQQHGAPASLQQVMLEIKAVRLQLNLLEADYLGRIIVALEGEATRLQERLRKIEQSEQRLREHMALAERAPRAASETERGELEGYAANRELRPGSDLVVLLSEKEALIVRESQVAQQIQFERRRWQTAFDAVNSVQVELNRIQAGASGR